MLWTSRELCAKLEDKHGAKVTVSWDDEGLTQQPLRFDDQGRIDVSAYIDGSSSLCWRL